MTAIFSDHFSIVYDICRAACHGDTTLGRSSVKKLAALIESSTPDDAALLKRLTKKAAKNPANFVQTALTDDVRRIIGGLIATIERADVREGYCCCGDPMEGHSNPMYCGHSPVDAGEYSAGLMMDEARTLTAAQSGEPK